MKQWLKEYFALNRKEQRGISILLALMLLSIIFSITAPSFIVSKTFDDKGFREQAERFMSDTLSFAPQNKPRSPAWQSDQSAGMEFSIHSFLANPFYFDPNQLDEAGWIKTGLTERIIKNILRYREKGGNFRNKKDLAKIYGMSDSVFVLLEPYITLNKPEADPPETTSKKFTENIFPSDSSSSHPKPLLLELNSADSSSLVDLPGIGPSFASRIIRYRDRLGGYISVDQLLEIKGMDSARLTGIRKNLEIDSSVVRKMNLNSIPFKDMIKHPYFEYYLVKAIFQYRDRIKSYDSVAQLKNIDHIYPELYEKISPYLEVIGN